MHSPKLPSNDLISAPCATSHHYIRSPRRVHSCGDSVPLIEFISPDELLNMHCKASSSKATFLKHPRQDPTLAKVSMVYNEYGELVREEALYRHPSSSDLNKTQLLRVIKKAYHHAVSSQSVAKRLARG